ncbi:unnamed protein product, partial [Mesorhabditis spiculigera]
MSRPLLCAACQRPGMRSSRPLAVNLCLSCDVASRAPTKPANRTVGTSTDDLECVGNVGAGVVMARLVKNPPNTLISFEQFMKMPFAIWLAILNVLSPLELLNLAGAHSFFKDLITKSPKRWGAFKWAPNFCSQDEPCDGYKLTRSRFWWETKRTTFLAYGCEYSYIKDLREIEWYDERRFTPVRPQDERKETAASDLYILFHNATFDQFGVGTDWHVPGSNHYRIIPSIRAATALMPIRGLEERDFRQMVELQPQCVAVHGDHAEGSAQLGSIVQRVVALIPGLQKFWIYIGHHASEMDSLLAVKAPTITAYCETFIYDKRKYAYVPGVGLAEMLREQLWTTLNALIAQWARGERDIDTISFILRCPTGRYTSWDREVDAGIPYWPDYISYRYVGRYRVDWARQTSGFWLIRRAPMSANGLLIGVKGSAVMLISCDYNFRRARTQDECVEFITDCDAAKQQIEVAFGSDDPLEVDQWPERTRRVITDRRAAMERAENALKEWTMKVPHNSVPIRELAVDRLLWRPVDAPFQSSLEFEPPEDRILHAYNQIHQNRD